MELAAIVDSYRRENSAEPTLVLSVLERFAAERADRSVAVVRDWLRSDESAHLMANATGAHYVTDGGEGSDCACGAWEDTDEEDWDHHMAYVGLAALADSIGGTDGDT